MHPCTPTKNAPHTLTQFTVDRPATVSGQSTLGANIVREKIASAMQQESSKSRFKHLRKRIFGSNDLW